MVFSSYPTEWQLVKLSDLGEVNRGRSRHRPRYAEHLYGGPYPFIQTGDIKASGGRINSYQQTYSEAGLAQSRLWPAGTMCITIAANIAETGILAFPACFPDSVIGFIADKSCCDVYFIEYMFRYLKRYIQHQASGSVQDNINLGTLERLQFPLPTLDEQKAIAHILGTLDDKIELNQQMNRTLEGIARAIFKSWFIDFDPVRAKMDGRQPAGMDAETAALFPNEFEDSPLGKIPKGWTHTKLKEICSIIQGYSFKSEDFSEEGDVLVRIGNFTQNGILSFSEKNTKFCKKKCADKFKLATNDLVICLSDVTQKGLILGNPGYIPDDEKQYILNQRVAKIDAGKLTRTYLYFVFLTEDFKLYAINTANSTTVLNLSSKSINEYLTCLPSKPILVAFSRVIQPIDERRALNDSESKMLTSIRDTLLPKLLSGEIRIPDAEKILEEVV